MYPLVALSTVAACGQTSAGAQGEQSSENAASNAVLESTAGSGTYTTDPKHRYIAFSYLHQGYSRPIIRWGDWDATLEWDAEQPESSSVNVLIDASSVDSGVEEFDGHLLGSRMFDAENYPEITFASTHLERTGGNTGKLIGDLTVKGITKPVTLDVTFNRGAFDENRNSHKVGFSATGKLLRSEFGIDLAIPFVGDEVDMIIEAEFEMSGQ